MKSEKKAPSSLAGGALERISAAINDLQAEHEVMAGPFDSSKWSVDVHVSDLQTLLAALSPEAPAREGVARYRHKKRGTEYTLIGVGRAQGELHDDDPVVLYRGDDGGLWARHQVEFCDGRFEELPALTPRHEAPAEGAGELWSVGSWLSAALDDPKVCDAMKADIREWFDNGGHLRARSSAPEARND